MFKKILVICAVGMMFFNNTIFAAEPEANQQIMLPITAGTITFGNSDFDSHGNASHYVQVTCPSPYLSPAARYPWVMAYPSAYQVGQGVFNEMKTDVSLKMFASNLSKPATQLSVTPQCDVTGCNIAVSFQYLYSLDTGLFILPASKDDCYHSAGCFGGGYLKVTYVAYCSTQPIQSDAGKHEPEQK